MPIIHVHLLAGRDAAKKQRLILELTHAAARALEMPADNIRVLLSEVPPEHWAVGGEDMNTLKARGERK